MENATPFFLKFMLIKLTLLSLYCHYTVLKWNEIIKCCKHADINLFNE